MYIVTAEKNNSSPSQEMYIYSPYTGKTLFSFKGHNSAITDLNLNFSSSKLVSSSEDGSAILWKTSGGKMEIRFPAYTKVNTAIFAYDDEYIIVGDDSGRVGMWKIFTQTAGTVLFSSTHAITALVNYKGNILIASNDGFIHNYNLKEMKVTHYIQSNGNFVKNLTISDNGYYIYYLSNDELSIYCVKNLKYVNILKESVPILSYVVSEDGHKIVLGLKNGMISYRHAYTSVVLKQAQIFKNESIIAMDKSDEYIIAAAGNVIKIFNKETQTTLKTITTNLNKITIMKVFHMDYFNCVICRRMILLNKGTNSDNDIIE